MSKPKPPTIVNPQRTDVVPVSTDRFAAHAGAGAERVTARDVLIPRMAILQKLSYQLRKSRPEYIDGAQEGQIVETGINQLFDPPVLILPVYYNKVWLEWYPRASNKGLAMIHNTDEIMAQTKPDAKRRPVLPDGNYIQETAQIFGFNMSADRRPFFLPMASTQLKRSRQLMLLATSERVKDSAGNEFQPPLWYRTYKLDVAQESNVEGEWFSWRIERGPLLTEFAGWEKTFEDALKFLEGLKAGQTRGDVETLNEERASAEVDGDM